MLYSTLQTSIYLVNVLPVCQVVHFVSFLYCAQGNSLTQESQAVMLHSELYDSYILI